MDAKGGSGMLGGHSSDRSAFLNALESDIARDPASVIVARIDLDRFSRIRENFGPAVARNVRTILEARLEDVVGRPDHLLRYGEDSFIATLQASDTEPLGLESLAMDIVEQISAPIGIMNEQIAVGSNVGVVAAAQFGEPESLRLLTGAELAIQKANSLGSRRVIVYEVAERNDPTRLPKLYVGMLAGIDAGQFIPHFQPVVEIPERRVVGAEALVRWTHPSHGILQPAEFIPEAEASGLVRDIDARVREASFAHCARWPMTELTLAINLSAADLDSPRLASDVHASLVAAALPPERVVLEITETALSQDWSRARRRLDALKELGVGLSVDDFGTGHMFLDRLSTGLFDILKIDRSLVVSDGKDGQGNALLPAVASMARALDMKVIAEGIETEDQLERVLNAGVTMAQGFMFHGPMSGDEFRGLVAPA